MKINLKKILLAATFLFLTSLGIYAAGSNERGIEYFRAGFYDAAKIYFMQNPGQTKEDQSENSYYLGQVYLMTQKPDSAQYFYNKSLGIDNGYPYAYIGLGELALSKNDDKSADDAFKNAQKYGKKDPLVYATIADAYTYVKKFDIASDYIERAKKINVKDANIYISEGNLLMAKGDAGGACGKYDNAILFDKDNKIAYLQEARVYKSINTSLAIDLLNRLVTMDPEYVPAYAELGEIYYKQYDYKKAISAYEKFINIPGIPVIHEAKYAQLLYLTDNYDLAQQQIEKVLQRDPNNFVMKRLHIYGQYREGKFQDAYKEMQSFMKESNKEDLISQDYEYDGLLMLKNNDAKGAIAVFNQAIAADSTPSRRIQIYKEIANVYDSIGDINNYIDFSRKAVTENPESSVTDYFYLGQGFYSVALKYLPAPSVKDPNVIKTDYAIREKLVTAADSAFATVQQKSPDSYMGSFWRARSLSLIDADYTKGLAKPYYEAALTKLIETNQDGKRNNEIAEVYTYLAYRYLVVKDYANSKKYWQKVLEIKPGDQAAQSYLDSLKKF